MAKAEWNGEIIAKSEDVQHVEGNVYFPRDSVDSSYLMESDTTYTCPWKGDATYYHLEDENGEHLADGAWSYESPKEKAMHIKGHVAFDTRKGIQVSS